MINPAIKYLFSLSLLLLVSGAYAQERLDLARAIELGLQNNYDVQIQKLDVDIAVRNNNWGQAGRYPTVTLSGNQNNSITYRQPTNPFAVPGQNKPSNLSGNLDVQFILFDGYFISLTKRRLESLQEQSLGNATLVVENTIRSIILEYRNVLLERERVQVRKRVMDFSRERYEYVKLKKDLGGAITFDVLQEQNNYLTDSSNYLLQQLDLTNAKRNLNLLLNEDVNTEFLFADTLHFDDEDYSFETLRQKMASSNTNLKNQYINQEIVRMNTQLAMADRFPTIALNVGANGSLDKLNANFGSNTGPDQTNTVGYVNGDPGQPVTNTTPTRIFVNQTNNGYSYGAYANFSLRYTLFNGSQVKRNIENSNVREKMAELTTEQLKKSLENDLLATHDVYNLRRQLVKMATTKLAAAELNLSLANERYRNGALSAIDLRIVQEQYQNAALENFQALYAVLSAQLDLVRLTGGLVDQYGQAD